MAIDVFVDTISSEEYFFLPKATIEKLSPVLLKLSSLRTGGGDITNNNIAPRISYYEIEDTEEITQSKLQYSESKSLFPNYIRARDAMFSEEMYRGFYIRNESTLGDIEGVAKNVQFWINGGGEISVENTATTKTNFSESAPYLNDIDSKYGLTDSQYEDFRLGGKSRTSLLGNVFIETFISPTKRLTEFNQDGDAIGIDLARQVFVPANTPIKLPNLKPGEFVGIYLRLTTKFSPLLKIPEDYSFIHLSYTLESGERLEKYPGQVRGTETFLPSIVLKFTTNYDKILEVIDENTENLYNRYPPFFRQYEDEE